jgi:hypothetical protein
VVRAVDAAVDIAYGTCSTLIVPVIPLWIVHWYGKEPAVGKSRSNVPTVWVPWFDPDENVTLWPSFPTHVHVTVPPTATRVVDGSKKLSSTSTDASIGAGGWGSVAVAVNVAGDPVTPEADACTVFAPAAGPSVHMVDAVPAALVVELVGSTLPPPAVTLHVTVLPETGVPSCVTATMSGFETASPASAL